METKFLRQWYGYLLINILDWLAKVTKLVFLDRLNQAEALKKEGGGQEGKIM